MNYQAITGRYFTILDLRNYYFDVKKNHVYKSIQLWYILMNLFIFNYSIFNYIYLN